MNVPRKAHDVKRSVRTGTRTPARKDPIELVKQCRFDLQKSIG